MKKIIPIVVLIIGLLVVVGAYFFVSRNSEEPEVIGPQEEIALLDVSLSDRPVVRLTPRSDGHWLDMEVTKLMIEQAETMDYELLYTLPDGRQQGVPGMAELSGRDMVEVELLLGSESSGKFRYDEGVETGTMTLRFRNEDGQLLAKFISEFHLQNDTDTLSSINNEFTYILDEVSEEYFVTMNTVGYPETDSSFSSEPYGVFSSSQESVPGVLEWDGTINYWDGNEWTTLESPESSDIGIFVK